MALLLKLQRCKVVVTTLGSRGSVLMRKTSSEVIYPSGSRQYDNYDNSNTINSTTNYNISNSNNETFLLLKNLPIVVKKRYIIKNSDDNHSDEQYEVIECSAMNVSDDQVVDTTGIELYTYLDGLYKSV